MPEIAAKNDAERGPKKPAAQKPRQCCSKHQCITTHVLLSCLCYGHCTKRGQRIPKIINLLAGLITLELQTIPIVYALLFLIVLPALLKEERALSTHSPPQPTKRCRGGTSLKYGRNGK
jgi:hypothetical protein